MKKKDLCGAIAPLLPGGGIIRQRQTGKVIIRFRSLAGNLTAAQLRALADLCEKYGEGFVHLTTRQGVEISGVEGDGAVYLAQEAGGILLPGACGPRVRTIVACPGGEVCLHGLVNSRLIAEKLDKEFFGREIGVKVKMAVSGCPNSCAKPQENDIGLMGVIIPELVPEKCRGCKLCANICPRRAITIKDGKPSFNRRICLGEGDCVALCPARAIQEKNRGFRVFAGGQVGQSPALGKVILPFVEEGEVLWVVGAILEIFLEIKNPGERLGKTLRRVGWREFQKKLMDKLSQKNSRLSWK